MISVALGIPLGLLAAFFRGKFETVTMRLADIFLSFPNIILILFLVSIFGPSIITVTVVIGILGWPFFARLMFGTVLSIKEKDYIEGAAAIGEKQRTIIFKYILPNAIAPILIQVTFRIAGAIILESSLSFLGMGVQPPAASWGNMLYNAQSITILSERPWMWLPPGLLLILTILSINFVGNGLRDALDPKTRL
ncbi:ABC transporter permease [Paenibacillus sonchi]|uniref:ABC transporter permease n=1 Tax=Paenibacillus sonchi TaxID=373687 RepID=A0A974PBH3_9BACL|nr:ABC transporter permease [Paenibacillus sonchi]